MVIVVVVKDEIDAVAFVRQFGPVGFLFLVVVSPLGSGRPGKARMSHRIRIALTIAVNEARVLIRPER